MAVSFFTVTKRLATVLRNGDIFSARSFLEPATAGAGAALGASVLAAGLPACALLASSLVILNNSSHFDNVSILFS